ncbi:right-handed parallel beta-helix repeat-containing protein [Myxococcus sp. Y35]|uniref:right-handed parallel beta-helix repeat-containing protein n=1 Tax=Pseudomyxococcus flavus TaxID=3115648 RepID=UPI003CED655E
MNTRTSFSASVTAFGLCLLTACGPGGEDVLTPGADPGPAAPTAQPLAAVHWVDDDGDQARAEGLSSWSTSIATAISQAASGDTIRVLPGTYRGALLINKPLTLVAMKNATTPVNPGFDPNHSDWPVIIEPKAGETSTLIQVNGNGDGTTVRGFYVRNAGSNGIQVRMSGSANAFTNLCEDVRIQGNRVENSRLDGIKVHQCNRIFVEGNRVAGFSRGSDSGSEHEHGIDFVAVGNSIIRNNVITNTGWVSGRGAGITVKSGSVNVVVEDNQIGGGLGWVAISAGEPVSTTSSWIYRSAVTASPPYVSRNICIRDNTLTGSHRDAVLIGCQECDVMGNTLGNGRIRVAHNDPFKSAGVCFSGNNLTALENEVGGAVATSGCSCQWTPAAKVDAGGSFGWTLRPGTTSTAIPADPTQNPTSPPPPPPPPTGCDASGCSLYFEAESGSGRYDVFEKRASSAASGGQYVHATAANYNAAAGDSATAETLTYSLQVSTSGVHYYWVRLIAPDSLQNSFFVSINGSAFVAQDMTVGAGWHWVKLRNLDTLSLQPGTVTFRVKNREKDVSIDRFFLTSDSSAVP